MPRVLQPGGKGGKIHVHNTTCRIYGILTAASGGGGGGDDSGGGGGGSGSGGGGIMGYGIMAGNIAC